MINFSKSRLSNKEILALILFFVTLFIDLIIFFFLLRFSLKKISEIKGRFSAVKSPDIAISNSKSRGDFSSILYIEPSIQPSPTSLNSSVTLIPTLTLTPCPTILSKATLPIFTPTPTLKPTMIPSPTFSPTPSPKPERKTYTRKIFVNSGITRVDFWAYVGKEGGSLVLADPEGKLITPKEATKENQIGYFSSSSSLDLLHFYMLFFSPKVGYWAMIAESNFQPKFLSFFYNDPLKMRLDWDKNWDKGEPKVGEVINFQATLDDPKPILQAKVVLMISQSTGIPGKREETELELYDDGLHADNQKNDGIYGNSYTPFRAYSLIVSLKAMGVLNNGELFERNEEEGAIAELVKRTNSIPVY